MEFSVGMLEFLQAILYLSAGYWLLIYVLLFIHLFHVSNFCVGNCFRFIPPDNFDLAMLTLELEFVKKGTKNEQVYELKNPCLSCLSSMVGFMWSYTLFS